ncbi:hypothetical protein [Prescottella agglutinans]|uniref:hypothetical protein n=1 Tax=Prescottella agglutinans TaxID=1644129 RepID=UPI002475624B|nr:hypothetical protein [Prescottella agglutinans]
MLPRLAEAGVRYIQVARARRHVTKAGDGVVILDDSRTPSRLYIEGEYSLYQEMTEAGTVPQSGGARLCSVHAKGDVLDPVIARITRGQPYRHVMGFEAGEQRRADKDAMFNTELRTGEYPLIEWGWTRDDVIAYTRSVTGTSVGRSSCTFCPFTFANKSGRAEVFARYAADPAVGAKTLLMEHLALALNPAQGLVGGRRLVDMLREQQLDGVLVAFEKVLDEQEHAIYEVRRILRPRKTDPTSSATPPGRCACVAAAPARACRACSSASLRKAPARASFAPSSGTTGSCASTSTNVGPRSRRSSGTSSSHRPSRTGRSTRTSTSGGPRRSLP